MRALVLALPILVACSEGRAPLGAGGAEAGTSNGAADAGDSAAGGDLDADGLDAGGPDVAGDVTEAGGDANDASAAIDLGSNALDTGVPVDMGSADPRDGSVDAGPGDTGGGGTAQIKFCNALALQNNGNLRLSLQVGDPPVVMTADSGQCSTPTGSPCNTVPAGINSVHLVDDTNQEFASGTVTIAAGEQWMMLATINNTTGDPTVIGGALKPQYTCSSVDPFPADGGVGP
jgi:hypothetical protein